MNNSYLYSVKKKDLEEYFSKQLAQKDNQIQELVDQVKLLLEKVDYLTAKLYGVKSEKSKRLPKNNLATTSNSVKKVSNTEVASNSSSEDNSIESPSINNATDSDKQEKPKREKVDRRTYEGLDEEVILVEITDLPKGATFLRYEDTVRLQYIPARIKKLIYRRPVYFKNDKFYTPELPEMPLEKCYAESSLLSAIITNKYRFHLPLERQLAVFKSIGVDIPKSTFNTWATKSMDMLKPLAKELHKVILRSSYVNMDETTVKLLLKGLDKCANAYMWGMTAPLEKLTYFHYDNGSRSQEVLKKLVKGFCGAIQSDDCASYNPLEKGEFKHAIYTLSCLAHIRRKIFEAIKYDDRAEELFNLINCIYHHEHLWQDENKNRQSEDREKLSPEEVRQIRLRDEFPIMIKIYRKLQEYEKDTSILPKSRFGLAIRYALNEAAGILSCLRDGRYALDNNAIERQFKDIILGRKNYLFVEGHKSGERTAYVYSLIACCKLNNIDPYQYFADVLNRINSHNHKNLEELLPHKWKPLS